jgi:adenylate cyclase
METMKSNLITSKEILEQAGISRATLNNYIKLGILPRPIVSNPGPDQEGVKQIGYFPKESLLWIRQVYSLKRQGKTMETIATLFEDKDWVEKLSVQTDEDPAPTPYSVNTRIPAMERRHTDKAELKVTIENLTSPAYLVNNNFEIEWINEQAEHFIFHRKIHSIGNVESRNIFKLLLDPTLHGFMKNLKDMVNLHCTLLQRNLSGADLAQTYVGITGDEVILLADSYKNRQKPAIDNLYRLPFSFVAKESGNRQNFLVHSETYREGTFIVFIPADQNSSSVIDKLIQREQIINELLNNRMPSMISLCTMVASIQDSERLCAELLPPLYFQLINDLWQAVGPVFEKYNGTYGRHAGNEMVYYFTRSSSDEYLLDSINCALELRDTTAIFADKWSRAHGLNHTLQLNIGIHEGQEYFGTIHSGGSAEFTALGDSAKVARRLSEFSTNGEIWTTKDLISKMPTEDRCGFTFGVYRDRAKDKILQLDSFALAGDLIKADKPASQILKPINNLAITEIRNRTSKL